MEAKKPELVRASINEAVVAYLNELYPNDHDSKEMILHNLNVLTDILWEPVQVRGHCSVGLFMIENDLPLLDKRFPDVLRLLANVLEIMRNE